MKRFAPLRLLAPLTGLPLLTAIAAAQPGPFYETNFAAEDDPSGFSFSIGNLDGQGAAGDFPGWLVTEGEAFVVSGPPSQSADRHVEQAPDSTIRANRANPSGRILVRAFHRGSGVEGLAPPPPGTSAAGVIAFQDLGAGEYSIHAWDGKSSVFLAPPPATVLPAGEWNEVLMSFNYASGARHFDVMANGEPLFEEVGFLDPGIETFAGFESSSHSGSSIDTVGFFASDGDYDGDGWPDDLEMRLTGGHPLDPDRTPGDINGNGDVNLLDAVLLGRISAGAMPADGLTPIDITRNGSIDEADAALLFDFAAGHAVPQP